MAEATPRIRQRTRGDAPKKSVPEVRRPVIKDKADSTEVRLKEFVNTQSTADPFANLYALGAVGAGMDVVEPPYNPYTLARLPYESPMLLQCIEVMALNCGGHGWALEYIGPDGQQESTEAKTERSTIEKLLKHPNGEYSLIELRKRETFDLETQGNSYVEMPRDRKGRISALYHLPAQTMRRTTRDREIVEVKVRLPRDGSDYSIVRKRFCRYVQIVNEKKIYFKEFGDPRSIDPKTGQVAPDLPFEEQATEVLHRTIYYPLSPYGVPRWINQLPSILGARQAEMTNYDFFKENAVPAVAILVSGGQLTQETLDTIEDQFLAVKGRSATHRMVFIEAKGDEDSASEDGHIPPPKLEIKPLRDAQQKDALFQQYDKDCNDKIRSSWRIPPILVGRSEDFNYATARTSVNMAESQVFGPSRRDFDETMDMRVLASYEAKFWSFRSQPAKITDNDAVVQALATFDNLGAMTPNTAITLANDFFDLDMPEITDEWGNWPFAIVQKLAEQGRLKGLDEIGEVSEITKTLEKSPPLVPEAGGTPPEQLPPDVKAKVAVSRALSDLHDILRQASRNEPAAAN